MGQYCDTKVLEQNWFDWLVASATPALNEYRDLGLLWTKVIGVTEVLTPGGQVRSFPDPNWLTRCHCVPISKPLFFNSHAGKLCKPVFYLGSRPVPAVLPGAGTCRLDGHQVGRVSALGYVRERPVADSWHKICTDVQAMCNGIAKRFNVNSEAARADLVSEALLQTISKINSRKLLYTPGRAPVFNLLTTTIRRIILSLLGREARNKQNIAATAATLGGTAASGLRRAQGRRIITVHRLGSVMACQS